MENKELEFLKEVKGVYGTDNYLEAIHIALENDLKFDLPGDGQKYLGCDLVNYTALLNEFVTRKRFCYPLPKYEYYTDGKPRHPEPGDYVFKPETNLFVSVDWMIGINVYFKRREVK